MVIQLVANLHAFGAAFTLGRIDKYPEQRAFVSFLLRQIKIFARTRPVRTNPRPLVDVFDLFERCFDSARRNRFAENRRVGTLRHAAHATDAFLKVEARNFRRDVTKIAQRPSAGGNETARHTEIRGQLRRGLALLVRPDHSTIEVIDVFVEIKLDHIVICKGRFMGFHRRAGSLDAHDLGKFLVTAF